jgi:hypothetical protein
MTTSPTPEVRSEAVHSEPTAPGRRRALILGAAALLAIALAAYWFGPFRDPIHSHWEGRTKLPSCGVVTLSAVEGLQEAGRDGVECLRQGMRSGAGGELTVRSPTTEGDSVVEYYRVTPTGSTEIYTDSTHDPNSNEGWSYGECDEPRSVLDVVC